MEDILKGKEAFHIYINGIEFTIIEVSQIEYKEIRKIEDGNLGCSSTVEKDGVYFGASHTHMNIIFLDKDLPMDRKRRTLLHELAHCYISEFITHEEKTFTEEMVADIVANSFDIITNIINMYFKE